MLSKLKGNLGVGHTRYSTYGGSSDNNTISVQPFVVDTVYGLLAVGHNGELVNAKQLRQDVSFCFSSGLLVETEGVRVLRAE